MSVTRRSSDEIGVLYCYASLNRSGFGLAGFLSDFRTSQNYKNDYYVMNYLVRKATGQGEKIGNQIHENLTFLYTD